MVPGWRLYQVTKTCTEAKVGDFALAIGDSIEFIFDKVPEEEPFGDWTDNEFAQISHAEVNELLKYYDRVDQLDRHFVCTPEVGNKLMEACYKANYNKEQHGYFLHWLFNRMGQVYNRYLDKKPQVITKRCSHN